VGRYLVSPPDETEWNIDAGDFVRRLRERWPDAEVRSVEDPQRPYGVDFVIPDVGGERVDGSLDRAGQTLSLDAGPRPSAEVAAWFRSLAPPEQPLVFYDQSMTNVADLEPGADPGSIVAGFV
jgi:hypothetical protein